MFAETDEPADDLLVTTSGGAQAYVQAKYRLQLSESDTSSFAGAIDQLVRQFRCRQGEHRPNDRLVLAVGPTSSRLLRGTLPQILVRARGLPASEPISAAAKNQSEQD